MGFPGGLPIQIRTKHAFAMSEKTLRQSDLDWVHRILDGDGVAWNAFVEAFSDRVWRRCWSLCNESCPYNKAHVHCVFHSLVKGGVNSASDDRPGCDDGLEIYAFTFEYFFNQSNNTGKLKYYDGRAKLETFVSTILHGNLRTDWIRHKRKVRIDQITRPPEIQRLSEDDGLVFEQMVLQRPTETIARKLSFPYESVEVSQERVTHALMANGNLHLILRTPESAIDEFDWNDGDNEPRIIPLKRSVHDIWESVVSMFDRLPAGEKILLDMMFDQELQANEILERCTMLKIELPVTPRTGNLSIHSIYQSVDAILAKLGQWLQDENRQMLTDASNWLESDTADTTVTVKGLKTLLKSMGVRSNGIEPPSFNAVGR